MKIPKFYENVISCVTQLNKNQIIPYELHPETLRFDHRGEFEWHELNCDFLLTKKFFTNRVKEMKKEKKNFSKIHAPEVILIFSIFLNLTLSGY